MEKPSSHSRVTEEDFLQVAVFRQRLRGLVGVFQEVDFALREHSSATVRDLRFHSVLSGRQLFLGLYTAGKARVGA